MCLLHVSLLPDSLLLREIAHQISFQTSFLSPYSLQPILLFKYFAEGDLKTTYLILFVKPSFLIPEAYLTVFQRVLLKIRGVLQEFP